MANESRPSTRTTRTATLIDIAGSSRTKSFRKTISSEGESVTFPDWVTFGVFFNEGNNNVRIMFNNTGSNFRTMRPGDEIRVSLEGSVVVSAQGVGASGTLSCIFW